MSTSTLLVPHRLTGPATRAVLEQRENRFLARCRLDSGEVVHAHVPDRGRLEEVLVPDAEVFLYPAENPQRRTGWSLLVAREPRTGTLVAIDPSAANARVRTLLDAGVLDGLGPGWEVWPERVLGDSRIDFLLTRGDERVALEVKSVGHVEDGVALFPDAPTTRGIRHLEELARYVKAGAGRGRLLFCVQRGDAREVAAHERIDPDFARALRHARRLIEVAAVAFDITLDGARYLGPLPVRTG